MKINANFELLSDQEMLNIKGGDGCITVGPGFGVQWLTCSYISDQMFSSLENDNEVEIDRWGYEWDSWDCDNFFRCVAQQ